MDSISHPTSTPNESNEYTRSGKGRFRFKSSKRHRSRRNPTDNSSHHHHHRSKRHKSHHRPPPEHESPPASGPPRLSPETAFRESLFDALGDDEGAEYWEAVYGQPIHTYAAPNAGNGGEGRGGGELEAMDEEEYAAYVRARMWERTREGMMEEQERMRQERAKRKKEREREQAHEYARDAFERGRFEKAMDESLRRGRERKRRKAWGGLWDEYSRSWEEVDRLVGVVRNTGEGEAERARKPFRNVVFWPVESGKRRNVSASAVEEFMRHAPAPPATGSGEEPSDDEKKLLATLKTERVRWHPDKIQHRYGVLGIDEVVMRSVTEVFQIVDRLWNELREKMA